MDWRQFAACSFEDPELFFPIGTTGPAAIQTEVAKAVCRPCPAQKKCLEQALAGRESGVWGGLSEEERTALRKRRRARTPSRHASA